MTLLEIHERDMVSGTEVCAYYLATHERQWSVREAATRRQLEYSTTPYNEVMRFLREKAMDRLCDAILDWYGRPSRRGESSPAREAP